MVSPHSKRVRGPHDVEGALLNRVDDPQALELHRGVAGLRRIEAARAAGDKPLVAVRPLMNQGKADSTPAGVCQQLGLQLGAKVVRDGGRRDELLDGHKLLLVVGSPHPRCPLLEKALHLDCPRRQIREEVPQLVGKAEEAAQLVGVLRGGELADGSSLSSSGLMPPSVTL